MSTSCKLILGSLTLSCLVAFWCSGVPRALACPFCSAVSQTLRQEMEAMDVVAIASIVSGTDAETGATFKIESILKGDKLLSAGKELRIENYFGKAKPDQRFLIMGVDPPDLLWSSPLQASDALVRYVESIHQLPEDSIERLKFYIEFLENEEALIARDAYDEFALASYENVKKLKGTMQREQLIAWIEDPNVPSTHKRLYLTMLGICGQTSDAALLEEMMQSDDPNRRSGLDALIACYATLKGPAALDLVDKLFLSNKKSQYADTYAAIMALRFHGTEGGVLEKERILQSLRLLLDRPELADLVIPDLARMQDWTQIDKLATLFKEADDDSSWVRVPVLNYLRACPLPEAAATLDELKEIDPEAFKRARTFFPQTSGGNSSSIVPAARGRSLAMSDSGSNFPAGLQLAMGTPRKTAALLPPAIPAGNPEVASRGPIAAGFAARPNLAILSGVVSMASITLGLAMWLTITGAGSLGVVSRILCRIEAAQRG